MKKYKVLEFLCEDNGNFSSMRLFTLLIVLATIAEWSVCIFHRTMWNPTGGELGLILSTLGIKTVQKQLEANVPIVVDTTVEQPVQSVQSVNETVETKVDNNVVNG